MMVLEYDVQVRELPRTKYKDIWYSSDGVYYYLFDDDNLITTPYHRMTVSRIKDVEDYINRFS
jgi:hypothetical protein